MLDPSLVVGGDERLELSLRLCLKGGLLILRQSQQGPERSEIFSLSSRQILFQLRLIQSREGCELLIGMHDSVFSEPCATGGRHCAVRGGPP